MGKPVQASMQDNSASSAFALQFSLRGKHHFEFNAAQLAT
jgi:hypothetical protein